MLKAMETFVDGPPFLLRPSEACVVLRRIAPPRCRVSSVSSCLATSLRDIRNRRGWKTRRSSGTSNLVRLVRGPTTADCLRPRHREPCCLCLRPPRSHPTIVIGMHSFSLAIRARNTSQVGGLFDECAVLAVRGPPYHVTSLDGGYVHRSVPWERATGV